MGECCFSGAWIDSCPICGITGMTTCAHNGVFITLIRARPDLDWAAASKGWGKLYRTALAAAKTQRGE